MTTTAEFVHSRYCKEPEDITLLTSDCSNTLSSPQTSFQVFHPKTLIIETLNCIEQFRPWPISQNPDSLISIVPTNQSQSNTYKFSYTTYGIECQNSEWVGFVGCSCYFGCTGEGWRGWRAGVVTAQGQEYIYIWFFFYISDIWRSGFTQLVTCLIEQSVTDI